MSRLIRLFVLVASNLGRIWTTDDLCQNQSSDAQRGGSEEYLPLRYATIKSSLVTYPCDTDRSIWIRGGYFYQFSREELLWKQLCIPAKLFLHQIPVVTAIAHVNDQLVMLINGSLYRTPDIRPSLAKIYLLSRLVRYSNVPILADRLHYLFTNPGCTGNAAHLINDDVLLADQDGHTILFSFRSLTIVYDFGRILQSQSVCQGNACKILYLGLSRSSPILMCIVQLQLNRALIFHQPFLDSNITVRQATMLNFTGEHLSVTASTLPDAYFLWDETQLFYTLNLGRLVSAINLSGCQEESFDQMDDNSPKHSYIRSRIDNDDRPTWRTGNHCINRTLDYLFVSQNEFFLMTETGEYLYGQEAFVPSMISVEQEHSCGPLVNAPHRFGWLQGTHLPWQSVMNLSQCLWSVRQQSVPCSAYAQSSCPTMRFESLFDRQRVYQLEKNTKQSFPFVLQASHTIPVMIVRSHSDHFDYSVNYTQHRLKDRTIEIHAEILVSTTDRSSDHLYHSSLVSFRVGTVQHSYSCNHAPSFSFQVEAACSPLSALRIEKVVDFDSWNESNSIIDIDWLRQNLPFGALDHFSPFYIQHKQTDPILLNYQYCFNQTCTSLHGNELGPVLIYAIAVDSEHEDYAHHLVDRTDSCVPISRTVDRLWRGWIRNMTNRSQLSPVASDRRRFYGTLLDMLGIANDSCLFFNQSDPIQINQSINQASQNDLKFIFHIIALKNTFSYCDLETFVLVDIEAVHPSFHPNRGAIFFIALFIFILLSILLVRLYSSYKYRENRKQFNYHCLNQFDAGQLHQWYDLARFLNDHQHTDEYEQIRNDLQELHPTTDPTARLMGYQ